MITLLRKSVQRVSLQIHQGLGVALTLAILVSTCPRTVSTSPCSTDNTYRDSTAPERHGGIIRQL